MPTTSLRPAAATVRRRPAASEEAAWTEPPRQRRKVLLAELEATEQDILGNMHVTHSLFNDRQRLVKNRQDLLCELHGPPHVSSSSGGAAPSGGGVYEEVD